MICAGSECKAHGQQHLRKDVRAHDSEVLLGRLGLLDEEHVAQHAVDARWINDAPRNDASLPHVNAVTSGRNTLMLSVQSMTMYASASGRRARGMLLRLPL